MCHENGSTPFTDEAQCIIQFAPQDVARHQPKVLVAMIESREWCGETHLARFEARMHVSFCVEELCRVLFFCGEDGKLFLWLAFDEDHLRFLFFGLCSLPFFC